MNSSPNQGKNASVTMHRRTFERIVREALDDLPAPFRSALENVAIVVEDEPDGEELQSMGFAPDDELFGLYQGVPLTERSAGHTGLPDRIVIYRAPLLRCFDTRAAIAEEIRKTVLHELGHHLGLEDDQMPY